MIRHLLIIIAMFVASLSWLIWLCRTVDPRNRYGSEIEYNYARYCAGCHGPHGKGDGRIGRFKHLNPADLTTVAIWQGRDDAQLIHSIAHGKNDMPAFSYYLTTEEQQELLSFVKENFRPVADASPNQINPP